MYRIMSLLYMIMVLLLLYIVLLNIHDDTFLFNFIFNRNRTTSSEDHGSTLYCMASDPGLHCLPLN